MKTCRTITIAAAALLWPLTLGTAASELRLYLPRDVSVSDKAVTLGQIAIPFGDNVLAASTADIQLGTIVLPGQELSIDRYTILARIGSSGIDVSKIKLTGAERVRVRLGELRITAQELMREAERFAQALPIEEGMRLHIMDMPADIMIKNSGKTDVKASLASKAGIEPVLIRLSITRDDHEVAAREVRFAKVPRKAPQEAQAPQPAPKPAAATAPLKPAGEKIISRNQPVLIVVELPGLQITAMGVALTDGRAGELIKVRNMDSKRDVVVQVRPDGSVAPIF